KIALVHEYVCDPRALLVDADDGFAAWHDIARDANEIGKAGIDRFGDDYERLAGCALFLRLRAMLPPIVSARECGEEHDAQHTFHVFGELHRGFNLSKGRKA